MKAHNLTFKQGHFYDQETKKRVELKDGSNVCMVIDQDFEGFVSAGTYPLVVLNEKEQEEKIKLEANEFRLIHKRKQKLFFHIKRHEGNMEVRHVFEIELLEDLYFYFINKTSEDERLFDCACVVKENTSGTIPFFEEVNGTSLNEIYKNTYVHYFGNKGNPACNAFDRFYDITGTKIETHRIKREKEGVDKKGGNANTLFK